MSLTDARLTESGGMRGLEAATNRVTEDYVAAFDPLTALDWVAAFWAEDPAVSAPANGATVATWNQAGSFQDVDIIAFTQNSGTTTVNKPSGGLPGDHYVLDVFPDAGMTSTPPTITVTGFTSAGSPQGINSGAQWWWSQTFYRSHTGSEGSTFTVTGLGGGGYVHCYLLRGAQAPPQVGTYGMIDGAGALVIPGVTVTTNASLAVIHAVDEIAANGYTTPAGWTHETYGQATANAFYSKRVDAGATGSVSITRTSTADRADGWMVVWPPAPTSVWVAEGTPTYISSWSNGKPAIEFLQGERLWCTFATTNQPDVCVVIIGETTDAASDLCDDHLAVTERMLLDRSGGYWRMFRGGVNTSSPVSADSLPHFFHAVWVGGYTFLALDGTIVINSGGVDANHNHTIALGSTASNTEHVLSKIAFCGVLPADTSMATVAPLLAWSRTHYGTP